MDSYKICKPTNKVQIRSWLSPTLRKFSSIPLQTFSLLKVRNLVSIKSAMTSALMALPRTRINYKFNNQTRGPRFYTRSSTSCKIQIWLKKKAQKTTWKTKVMMKYKQPTSKIGKATLLVIACPIKTRSNRLQARRTLSSKSFHKLCWAKASTKNSIISTTRSWPRFRKILHGRAILLCTRTERRGRIRVRGSPWGSRGSMTSKTITVVTSNNSRVQGG